MKSIRLLLLTTIIFSISKAQAQTQFGLKAGINYVNNVITSIPNPNNDYRFSYHAGIFTRVEFTDRFSISPELIFSGKGYQFDPIDAMSLSGGTLHLNYLNFLVIAGYSFNKLSFELGPEFGFLLSAKSKLDTETIDVSSIWDNKMDLGIATGFSHQLIEKMRIGVRYIHGLSSVVEPPILLDQNGQSAGRSSIRYQNRTFQLSLGYRLE